LADSEEGVEFWIPGDLKTWRSAAHVSQPERQISRSPGDRDLCGPDRGARQAAVAERP
jgi:hypothetical protein